MRIKDWLKNNSWSSKLWWLIIGAIITLLCEKAYNKIVPDNPIIVKEDYESEYPRFYQISKTQKH